jgi:uncharacterized membrane protein
MFDLPFDFFSLVIAIVAFIFARKAFNQAAMLRARLDAIEASTAATTSMPPPIPVREAPIAPSEPDEIRIETTEAEAPPSQPAPPPPIPDIPAAASQPGPGFEERIGTRWVVWVGGLTLALGGFFMVRYSIDAGLLGPGVRTLLGGLFALALLAAGEWTRSPRRCCTDRRWRASASPPPSSRLCWFLPTNRTSGRCTFI